MGRRSCLPMPNAYAPPKDVIPPVSINDLGDMNMLTAEDLAERQLGRGQCLERLEGERGRSLDQWRRADGRRAHPGGRRRGASVRSGVRRSRWRSPSRPPRAASPSRASPRTARFRLSAPGRVTEWISSSAQPFQSWMLSKSSSHLWRADLPKRAADRRAHARGQHHRPLRPQLHRNHRFRGRRRVADARAGSRISSRPAGGPGLTLSRGRIAVRGTFFRG